MRRWIPLLVLFLGACHGEPTTNEPTPALADASLEAVGELTAELRTVKDRESWLKAQKRIEKLANGMRDLREKGDGLRKMTTPTRDAMEDRYRDRVHEAMGSLKAEMERITNQVEQGKDYMKRIDHLMRQKLEESKQ